MARRKDIIRVRSENVCGAEVDRVLLPHPDVELAAAVGVPEEMGDEDILGAVKLRGGANVLPEQLKAWCAEPLAVVKVPGYVLLTDQLPLTYTHSRPCNHAWGENGAGSRKRLS
ncbi:AMP-binding enzyme [Ciceribacter selenitireducens]|uniref:AMP-binding enzyme n=1 Tax=Ciceribacter selenitireducens TaxID=448181 RepID=UPI000E1FC083|nr:hypothetical protein [Ciceribacter selenitireducens]